jgi:hypothetical protein
MRRTSAAFTLVFVFTIPLAFSISPYDPVKGSHSLQQVTTDETGLTSVDADADGIIDIGNGNPAISAVLKIKGATTLWSAIDFYDGTARLWGMGKDNSDNFYIDQFNILTPAFYIQKTTHNVGIGTSNPNPTRKLTIEGDLQADDIYLTSLNQWVSEIYQPVSGACGSSNGASFYSAPTTNLCSVGPLLPVTGSGPWYWYCLGDNGGSHTACSALKRINGVCGASNGQALTGAPTTNLCSVGSSSAVTGTGPWYWSCSGIDGGVAASCVAYVWEEPPAYDPGGPGGGDTSSGGDSSSTSDGTASGTGNGVE